MKRNFIYAFLMIIFSICIGSVANATNTVTNAKSSLLGNDKTFILRITSNDPNMVVPFNFRSLVVGHQGLHVTDIGQSTPYETTINALFVGLILNTNEAYPELKFSLSVLQNSVENTLLSGVGHSIFAHEDANGMGYIITK